MKKLISLLLAAVLLLSLVACGGSSESAAPQGGSSAAPSGEVITLKLSHSLAPTHPYHLGSERFAELVDEYTNGQIKIDIFPSSQLGDERANIEDLQMGTLDIAVTSTGPLGNFCSNFLAFDLWTARSARL